MSSLFQVKRGKRRPTPTASLSPRKVGQRATVGRDPITGIHHDRTGQEGVPATEEAGVLL